MCHKVALFYINMRHFKKLLHDLNLICEIYFYKRMCIAFNRDKAGIAPLLDVDDMVAMQRPDWKCVFTYVQSFYRRFKDE